LGDTSNEQGDVSNERVDASNEWVALSNEQVETSNEQVETANGSFRLSTCSLARSTRSFPASPCSSERLYDSMTDVGASNLRSGSCCARRTKAATRLTTSRLALSVSTACRR